ncbi:MAG TPA: hypothetical protein VGP80_01910 [Gemmatimonadales bacterium]|jgi:hypothetical protein|nr:hypothetical protein [Gemmatimonadales bacterium]
MLTWRVAESGVSLLSAQLFVVLAKTLGLGGKVGNTLRRMWWVYRMRPLR